MRSAIRGAQVALAVLAVTVFVLPSLPASADIAGDRLDFVGDGAADLAVFRPSTGTWWVQTIGGATSNRQWGASGDTPVSEDYDGDGTADFAVFRPTTRTWWIRYSSTAAVVAVNFGLADDYLVPADYDGDGKADIAIYRTETAQWVIRQSSNLAIRYVNFGLPELDFPQVGDYDGDGKADPALQRENMNYILNSSNGSLTSINYGLNDDANAPADYDGDGKTDLAKVRNTGSALIWYIRNSTNGTTTTRNWGLPSDDIAPADYDGDGKADIAIFRPSNSQWWIVNSTFGFTIRTFGLGTDVIPANVPIT